MSDLKDKQNPDFLEYVYQLNEGYGVMESLHLSLEEINQLEMDQINKIGLLTYAEGKWTIHKIIQHLIDWERIWGFRAILFARSEGSIPDAHDQEVMGKNSNADEIPLERLINELRIVRQSTIMMFESFNQDLLETNCKFFEYEMPLYAIGLTVSAHQTHHFRVIREKYFPLAI